MEDILGYLKGLGILGKKKKKKKNCVNFKTTFFVKLCKNLQINGETGHASAHCLKRRQDIETIYIIPELCVLPQSWGLPDLLTVLLIAEEIKIDNQKMSWIYTHCEINKQEKKKSVQKITPGLLFFF